MEKQCEQNSLPVLLRPGLLCVAKAVIVSVFLDFRHIFSLKTQRGEGVPRTASPHNRDHDDVGFVAVPTAGVTKTGLLSELAKTGHSIRWKIYCLLPGT